MPRTYKPNPGSKTYKKYNQDIIEQALNEYTCSNSSLDSIAKKYEIHRSVLYRHCRKTMKKPGGQTVLSKDTEEEFIKYINVCADWGYPLEPFDLRMLVKLYLDKAGITEKRFRNNMPGPDFVASFLKRHKDVISQRLPQNIKRNRAAVSPEVIKTYFEELKISLNDVPLTNIINYDETNFADDPGRKKILTRRGTKYPERVMNHSKSSISVMMSCTAEGKLLPPYVVYKSQSLYDTWTHKGPKGARYNKSQSGWFDGMLFEDWIQTIIIPYFRGKPGKKILIGDNLSSHLSISLIKLCHEEDIHFVFLPANSTHITQPLDVAFFRPMKLVWRNIVYQWKKTDGRKEATIPKGCFPRLLANLLENLKDNEKTNILSGFRKTGISPFNPAEVLNRLPRNDFETHQTEAINESILEILKDMRYGSTNIDAPKRKRKIVVKPGKCTSIGDSYVEIEADIGEGNKKPRKTTKLEKDVKENTQNIDIPRTSYKGKGVGKKTRIPSPLFEVDDEGSMPVIMLDNEILVDHTETVENDYESSPTAILFNKNSGGKIQILSDISIKDSKFLTAISFDEKREIVTKPPKDIIIQQKEVKYYKYDEAIRF